MSDELIELLDRAARQIGQRLPADRRAEVGGLVQGAGKDAPAVMFGEAWRAGGLDGVPVSIARPTPAELPFAGWREDIGWFLVLAPDARGGWRAESPGGSPLTLANLDGTDCIALPRRTGTARAAPRAAALVWQAVRDRKGVFIDAALATAVVNFLTLASSIYSMQVFDRVIPNQGLQTLWVLTVGVAVAVGMEFLLKHVRGRSVDRANTAIDHELSRWFFGRMLGIRMDRRPASVGTLASQIKGFELVRGVLGSTSLFVLADIPFAVFFIVVIGLIGGWVVLVPLLALPLALLSGLMFQRAIGQLSRQNLAGNNRKTGLLVESIDGAESLKASGADWKIQSRWNQLVEEVGAAEQDIRDYSALSQNLTVAMQQFSYVAIIAVGAYLAAENQLTMGALLACSIISNRAMMPIIQLPGVMVQWAHASAAIEALDQILALPGEGDDAPHALTPQSLEPACRFERVRFAYGAGDRVVMEADGVIIRPGERVGVLGSIGSGKSTMLKLASGLYRPSEGKLFLGGIDMALLAPAVRREAVGYMPQDLRLFSGTLRDNLLLGVSDPGDGAILEAAHRTGLIELVAGQPKGLALEITEGGRGVSGGQRQLIAMTRLLLARPRMWLLDEPTGSMDAATEMRMVAMLREVAEQGATLLVATHKSAMLALFDRLIVLQGGRIVVDGPRDAVVAKLAGQHEEKAA